MDRTMTHKVSGSWSAPRPVAAGALQWSVFGAYLFTMTIDNLEEGFLDNTATTREEIETLPDPGNTRATSRPRPNQRVRDMQSNLTTIKTTSGQECALLPRAINPTGWTRREI
jgi:hypothetical protein